MNKEKKTTVQDSARDANVSVGTFHRVIQNRGKISPDKKKKKAGGLYLFKYKG